MREDHSSAVRLMRAFLVCGLLAVAAVGATAGAAAQGAQCVPFAPNAVVLSQCAAVLSPPPDAVYMPDGMELAAMDGQVAALLEPLALEEVPRGCVEALYAFTCAASFRACTQVQTRSGTSLAVAAPPCRSVCDAAVQECGALFAAVGASELLPQCDAEDPVLAPLPAYPTSSLDIPGQEPIPCTAGNVLNKSAVEVRSVVDLLPGRCEEVGELPLSQCGAVIPPTTRVFVPDGSSQAALDAAAAERTGAFLLGTAPRVCRDAALEFVCAAAFRRCAPVDVLPGVAVELPAAPCFDVCDAVEEECHTFVHAELGQPPTVCDAAEYPSTFTALELVPGVLSVEVPCFRYELLQEPQGLPVAQCVEVSAEELQRSQCHAVVDYPVYVPEGLSVAELDAAAAAATGPALLGLVPPACADATLAFACASAFRPCVRPEVAPGVRALLPAPPCRGACDRFLGECAQLPVFAAAPDALPQCDAVSEATGGQSEYPRQGEPLVLPLSEQVVLEVECSAGAAVSRPFTALPPGACEPMQETEWSQCSRLVSGDVFVPLGATQRDLDFTAHNQSFALLWHVVEEECSAAAFRFACASTFAGCDAYELLPGVVLSLPRGPCRSVCDEFNFFCEEYLVTEEADSRVQCARVLPPDQLVVPVSEELIFTASCVAPPYNVSLHRECPPLTTMNDDDDECVLICPNPVFDDTQYLIWEIVISIIAWISFLSCILIICCFALHPIKRQYPRSNPAWQQFYYLPLPIFYLLIGFWGGQENLVCVNGHNAEIEDNAFCFFSSFMVYWGAWIGLIWYNWVGISLLLVITGMNRLPPLLAQLIMHLGPLIFYVIWYAILAATDSWVSNGISLCVITKRWHQWQPDVVFWIPWAVLFLTGISALASVFLYTLFIMGWRSVQNYWRIMAYLVVGLMAVAYGLVYHWELRIEEDELGRSIEGWVLCAASNLVWERCDPERLIAFPPYLINTIASLIIGPLFALILLSDGMFIDYWMYLVRKYILRQDVPYPFDAIKRAEKIGEALGSGTAVSTNSSLSAQ